MNDYSLNIPWLIRQFQDETKIINADPEMETPGIFWRRYRRDWLSDILVATGHKVYYKTGKVEHIRKPKSDEAI